MCGTTKTEDCFHIEMRPAILLKENEIRCHRDLASPTGNPVNKQGTLNWPGVGSVCG